MTGRWTRQLTQGALALGIALAVATPTQALTWCNMMNQAVPKCCCHGKVAPAIDVPAVGRTACCETRAPEAQAPASLHETEVHAPAPVLAALFNIALPPPPLPLAAIARAPVPHADARAGPGRALHDLNAIYLI